MRLALLLLLLFPLAGLTQPEAHKKVVLLMGSRFEITAVHENDTTAWRSINAAINEITRIEKLISSWDPNSQTSAINNNAGIAPVKVDNELLELIFRSKKISSLTDGIFDISYASLDKIWKFDGSVSTLPATEEITASVSKINYEDIMIDRSESTVYLKKQGMKIGFGAIGKGYAANQAMKIMKEHGIENGVVNAGGDLVAWGHKADGKNWSVSIADPNDKEKIVGWLTVNNQSVVTSGNYEKFIDINGERYTHIINPKSGWPVKGLKSVTIICENAELADALATSVFIMGMDNGLNLINQLKGIEGFVIDDNNKLWTSTNLQLDFEPTMN